MEDRGGRLELLLPYATLEPVRELLLQMFMGEKFGRDSIWETHLAQELWFTDVEMTAVMDERYHAAAGHLRAAVGSRIMFGATPDCVVEMRCAGVPMYTAKMGRRGSHIAVQIEDRIDRDRKGSVDRAWSLALDVLMAVAARRLDRATIILNRRSNVLRGDSGELEKLTRSFRRRRTRADHGVGGLKVSAQALQERIERAARALADDLQFLIERGGSVADRLENADPRRQAA